MAATSMSPQGSSCKQQTGFKFRWPRTGGMVTATEEHHGYAHAQPWSLVFDICKDIASPEECDILYGNTAQVGDAVAHFDFEVFGGKHVFCDHLDIVTIFTVHACPPQIIRAAQAEVLQGAGRYGSLSEICVR